MDFQYSDRRNINGNSKRYGQNLGIGSAKAAKQADKKLVTTKYVPPVSKPTVKPTTKPVKNVYITPSRPTQNLQEMTPGPVIKNKIGDFKKTVSDERFVPVTFERATVKIKDPSTGLEFDEERAIPEV